MRAQTAQIIPTKESEHKTTVSNARESAPTSKHYGYARITGREPNENEQLHALRTAGVQENCIYLDSVATYDGSSSSEYSTLLQNLRKGDVLFIKALDKLGRSYEEVINQWQLLTKVKRIDVVVLDIPLLDTRTKPHQVTDAFMSDLALQFLAYVALRERESIRQRQHEGIMAAQARGVRFGRPPKPIPPQFEMLLQQWRNKEISSRKAAQQLGVAQETFLRWSRRHSA